MAYTDNMLCGNTVILEKVAVLSFHLVVYWPYEKHTHLRIAHTEPSKYGTGDL